MFNVLAQRYFTEHYYTMILEAVCPIMDPPMLAAGASRVSSHSRVSPLPSDVQVDDVSAPRRGGHPLKARRLRQ